MVSNQSWQRDALCAKLAAEQKSRIAETGVPEVHINESFFSDSIAVQRKTKKICVECPVRKQCLEYALSEEERFGVWGGADESQIRRALSIDQYGHPTIRLRDMKCPYCESKNIRTVLKRQVKTKVRCEDCKLIWWSRRKRDVISIDAESETDLSDDMDSSI